MSVHRGLCAVLAVLSATSASACAPGASAPAAAPVASVPSAGSEPLPPAWAWASPSSRRAPGEPAPAPPPRAEAAPPAPAPPAPRAPAPASSAGGVSVGFSVGGFQHHSVSLDGGVTRRRSMSATGSCEGDCALGASTIAQLVLEQSPDAPFACLSTSTKATFVLRLAIDARGKVVRAALGKHTATPREASCVLAVFSRASFPPGSDPAATSVVELEMSSTVTPRAP